MALTDIEKTIDDGGVPWRTCATCHALDSMSTRDAKILRGLLANRAVKFKTLAKILKDDPDAPTIPWEALSRHARAGCSANEHLR